MTSIRDGMANWIDPDKKHPVPPKGGSLAQHASRLYRKSMTGALKGLLLYFTVLWAASYFQVDWIAIAAMWIATFFVLVGYFQPALGGIAALVEWINWKDDKKTLSTLNAYLMLFITTVSWGGLALILSFFSAGLVFPLLSLFILFCVVCMVRAGEVNIKKWMTILTTIAVIIMVVATLRVVPFGEWSKGFYESTGYSVNMAPSKGEVAARKAIAENERLIDVKIGQCIDGWKSQHMGRGTVVRETEITKAIEDCNSKYRPVVSPPSHKEGVGAHGHGESNPHVGKSDGGLWAQFMGLRDINPFLFWALLVLGHIPAIWFLKWVWDKCRSDNTETVAIKKVVEKTKTAGTIFGWTYFEWLILLAVIWGILSYVAGTPIASMNDLNRVFERKSAAEKVVGYPGQFFTADELSQWEARVDGPQVHRFFGDMSGPLSLVKLVDSGKRADIVSQFESGRGFIVKVDELDPSKDIVFNNNVCPAAKIPAGGNRHQTVCTSSGRSGDGSLRFSIEMGWTATERYAVLIQDDTRQVIRLRFTQKFP